MKQKIEFENPHALKTNRASRRLWRVGNGVEEPLSLKRNRRQTVRDEGYPSFLGG